jgi:hypothetical protein
MPDNDLQQWLDLPVDPQSGNRVIEITKRNPLPVEAPQPIAMQSPDTGTITEVQPTEVTPAIGPIAKLLGLGNTERYQTWPEKLVRSALTAPHDILSGEVPVYPGLRREDFTDIPASDKSQGPIAKLLGLPPVAWQPQDAEIERAQDVAALAGVGPLAVAPAEASLGSGMVRMSKDVPLNNPVYHGTQAAPFEHFKSNTDSYNLPDMLGTHVAKDRTISENIATRGTSGTSEKGQGHVYDLHTLPDEHFLEVDQPHLPYIEDKTIPKTNKNVAHDDWQVERMIMKHAFEKDPSILARYLETARRVPKEDAPRLAQDMAAGKKVDLSVDGEGWDLDRFIRNFGGKPYNKEDRALAVNLFKKDMQEKGYAGLKYINTGVEEGSGNVKDHTSYIVFDPSKHLMNTKTGKLMSDTTLPGVGMAAAKSAAPFYSAIENAVKNAKQPSATADQWLGYLKNQPGVKQEELDWVLGELPKGKITKAELEQHIAAHKVELKEVNKGDKKSKLEIVQNDTTHAYQREPLYNIVDRSTGEIVGRNYEYASADREVARREGRLNNGIVSSTIDRSNDTKFSQYQLPGGENYQEKLLTLPQKTKQTFEEWSKENGYGDHEGSRNLYNDIVSGARTDANNRGFVSSHWDEPNVLAHARMNDRFIPDETKVNSLNELTKKHSDNVNDKGTALTENEIKEIKSLNDEKKLNGLNNKTLHIEEIQSDWHQAGRKQGYVGEKEKLQPEFDKIEQKIMDSNDEKIMGNPDLKSALKEAVDKKIINDNEAKLYQRYTAIENGTPVPDAPFKQSWSDLALKRIIRHAAENGYDAISWTPGEAQALRYQNEIRQKLDSIEWHNKEMGKVDPSGTKKLLITPSGGSGSIHSAKPEIELSVDKNGTIVSGHNELKGKSLDSVLGKDIANQIMGKDEGNIDAKGYVMNSEGMKGFYDKMLVDKANAIAKKYGGKVEEKPLQDTSKFYPVTDGNGKWRIYDPKTEDYAAGSNLTHGRSFASKEEAQKAIEDFVSSNNIHFLKLPQGLKDTATQKGFPLFTGNHMITPVTHNPFEGNETVDIDGKKIPINNKQDVMWGAGASNNSDTVNIDRAIPKFDPKVKLPNGQPADLHKYLAVHELAERKEMDRLIAAGMSKEHAYAQAHSKVATPAEKAAVAADGVNWKEYEKVMDGYLEKTEHEKKHDAPADLYVKPYSHNQIRKMKFVPVNEQPKFK